MLGAQLQQRALRAPRASPSLGLARPAASPHPPRSGCSFPASPISPLNHFSSRCVTSFPYFPSRPRPRLLRVVCTCTSSQTFVPIHVGRYKLCSMSSDAKSGQSAAHHILVLVIVLVVSAPTVVLLLVLCCLRDGRSQTRPESMPWDNPARAAEAAAKAAGVSSLPEDGKP